MKKIVSLILCLVLMLSLGTVASATESSNDNNDNEEVAPATTTSTYTDTGTVTVQKTYNLTNVGTTSPEETFGFSTLTCTGVENAGVGVTKDNAPVPYIDSVKYQAGDAGKEGSMTKDITITLPEYTAVGVYTYTFKETDNGTAGVTYRNGTITLVVTVIEQEGKVRVAAVHTEIPVDTYNRESKKSAHFDNEYSAGSLAVKKIVAGNMGDQKKEFNVTVTFNAPAGKTVKSNITYVVGEDTKNVTFAQGSTTATAQITLKHDQTVTFTNIPYGVTYTVEESSYSSDGYETTYKFDDSNRKIDTATENVEITNTKGATVDTGIYMDSLPYVLLLAVVVVAAFLFLRKKRHAGD